MPTPVILADGNTTRHGTGCWCGTVPNVNSDPSGWGYCPCSVTTKQGQWSAWGEWSICAACQESSRRQRMCTNQGEQVSDQSNILCSGPSFERRLCSCGADEDSFQKRSIIKENRNLRITDIRTTESGMYYCSRDDGSSGTPDNEHIVSRAEIVVIPMTASHYVANFTLDKRTSNSLFSSPLELKWDVFDELSCTDCGPFAGDARQYANCHYMKDEKKTTCIELGIKNQVKVRQCHTACRPRPNQREKDVFVFEPSNGMPDIPSHKNVRKKWRVYSAGVEVSQVYSTQVQNLFRLPCLVSKTRTGPCPICPLPGTSPTRTT